MDFIRKLFRRSKFWPEIPSFFYLFALMLYGPVSEQYIYKYYSDQVGFNYTIHGKTSNNCPTGLEKNSTQYLLQVKVQDLVAQFTAKQAFVQNVPAMFVCLIYGPLSDAFGRKPIILLGMCSGLLSCVVTSVSIFLNTNVNILYLANLLLGLGGYFQAEVMAIMSYICDLNEGKDRGMRIAIIDLLLFACITLSSFSGGVFLETFGFQASCYLMLALYTAAVVIAIFHLKESLSKENRVKITSYCLIWFTVFICVFQSRPKRSQLLLLLAITVLALFALPASALTTILLYLLNAPLCWSADDIGYYRGTYLLILGIGGALGTKLLPKVMNLPLLMIVSTLSTAGYYIGLCFSHSKETLYPFIFAGFFAMVNSAVVKGEMSRFVTEKEQGSLFAFLSSSQALVIFITVATYQKLYRTFNAEGKPGYTFLFGAAVNILPLIVIFIYWCKMRSLVPLKKSEYTEFLDEDDDERKTNRSNSINPPS